MLERIQQLVNAVNDPRSDVATKRQAIELLNEIKSSDNAMEIFISLVINENSNDLLKFYGLSTLIELMTEGLKANANGLNLIKFEITKWLKFQVLANKQAKLPDFLMNKISEVLTTLFMLMYSDCNGNQWNSFFDDLMNLFQVDSAISSISPTTDGNSLLGLEFFNKLCLMINSEIADQSFIRSKESQLKNNNIKDWMRDNDIMKLNNVWFQCLKLDEQVVSQCPGLINSTLDCIGSFISWIDINLIIDANNYYLQLIYKFLNHKETKISCHNCILAIISKKMKPMDKLAFLNMINLTNELSYYHQSISMNPQIITFDNLEVWESLVKLITSFGMEFTIIIEQTNDDPKLDTLYKESVISNVDTILLEKIIPILLEFMNNEFDSITGNTFPFWSNYLAFLKKYKSSSPNFLPLHKDFLNNFQQICFKRMKFSDDEITQDDFEEFNEAIRFKLKIFQEIIVVIDPILFANNITQEISTNLMNCKNESWQVFELTIYQIFNLSECIKNNYFGLNKNEIMTSQPSLTLVRFLNELLMMKDFLLTIDNEQIQILFMELIVKNYNFIFSTSANTASATDDDEKYLLILNIFMSPFAMFNKRENVRLRSWYLFTRFLKLTRINLKKILFTNKSLVNEITNKISPLLQIKVTSINAQGTDDNDTIFDNQLYIFEGIGFIVTLNNSSHDPATATDSMDYDILDQILTPLFTQLEGCITQGASPVVILECHHILMAIGTLARGLHIGLVPENQVNNMMVNKKLINDSLIHKFSNIAEVILVTFSFFNKFENIRDASRFTFARLIPILNNKILPFINKLIELILSSTDLKSWEMIDFLGFLSQLIHMFHADLDCYQLFNQLLSPLINKVHSIIKEIDEQHHQQASINKSIDNTLTTTASANKNIVVTDSYRDKVLLKKAYYTFLQSFTNNSVTSILLSDINRSILPITLNDLVTYTPQEIQETSMMKVSLNVLCNFIKCFGSGSCLDNDDINRDPNLKIDGLNEFFIMKCVPMIFEIPFNPIYKFNIKEGNFKTMASDLARLLRELFLVNNNPTTNENECVKYLTQIYLPQIQLPQELSIQLVNMLTTMGQKQFEKWFVDNFISVLKQDQ
ncbi:Los1p [Saccharomyces cerevisiae x Saccharomyces kudriavzevii VIN7]|uniref:Exportin-T n=1 Tax=Saccharomyces cerevisiae x Saccharomyces kudriavzevii (strain VIN7) TaxID=1095631 RepID=H0GX97_SACCK|nr:Los1p [Saccharomyces cerevisiae x Saccharomyces kudriavzevii VIN7]